MRPQVLQGGVRGQVRKVWDCTRITGDFQPGKTIQMVVYEGTRKLRAGIRWSDLDRLTAIGC